ncbi:unnamed protein product [Trifolium pratense]|uniref:Uncharacterized protein n=1 Tax=Trifolium pratense TaxID=57577 RepID=A0ACB0JSN3_TRIPR|nr:unnamed protein product [Trifolium pratense]
MAAGRAVMCGLDDGAWWRMPERMVALERAFSDAVLGIGRIGGCDSDGEELYFVDLIRVLIKLLVGALHTGVCSIGSGNKLDRARLCQV